MKTPWNIGPTEMVRDMRGMRGKSCGLVDVFAGWRPKRGGTVLAGEAFAADSAHRHALLQGGVLGRRRRWLGWSRYLGAYWEYLVSRGRRFFLGLALNSASNLVDQVPTTD